MRWPSFSLLLQCSSAPSPPLPHASCIPSPPSSLSSRPRCSFALLLPSRGSSGMGSGCAGTAAIVWPSPCCVYVGGRGAGGGPCAVVCWQAPTPLALGGSAGWLSSPSPLLCWRRQPLRWVGWPSLGWHSGACMWGCARSLGGAICCLRPHRGAGCASTAGWRATPRRLSSVACAAPAFGALRSSWLRLQRAGHMQALQWCCAALLGHPSWWDSTRGAWSSRS